MQIVRNKAPEIAPELTGALRINNQRTSQQKTALHLLLGIDVLIYIFQPLVICTISREHTQTVKKTLQEWQLSQEYAAGRYGRELSVLEHQNQTQRVIGIVLMIAHNHQRAVTLWNVFFTKNVYIPVKQVIIQYLKVCFEKPVRPSAHSLKRSCGAPSFLRTSRPR